MSVRKRFCDETGLTEAQAYTLARWARQAARANEAFSNGDPFPGAKSATATKSTHSKLWGAEVDRYGGMMSELVRPFGYIVAFTGLRPCLLKDGRYTEIPD